MPAESGGEFGIFRKQSRVTLRDDRGVSSSSQKEFSVVISDSSVTQFPIGRCTQFPIGRCTQFPIGRCTTRGYGPFSSDSFSDNSVVRLSATRSILLV